MDNLTVQKESAKAEKQTLKNELLRQISQAETTKNSCLNAIPGGCKQSLPALTMTAGQELANRSTNINESLTSLKDKLTQVKNSCTGTAPTAQGTTTISACENLAKKKVYLTFDQPRKYLGYDGGSRLFWKLMGIVVIFLSMLYMFGFIGGLIDLIFSPLFRR